jgi:hypothetical protein
MSGNTYRVGTRLVLVPMLFLFCVDALAGDRGSVTAVASLSSQVSAFVGFSSGAVLYCTRKGGCTELEGTLGSRVTAIDIPRGIDSMRAWVGYEDGSVLFCTLTGGCIVQDLQAQQQIVPNRGGSGVISRVPGEIR